jgi:hypothetical protein
LARKTQSFHGIERQDLVDRAAPLTSKEFADLIEGGQTDVVRSMLEHGANSSSKRGTPRSWPHSKPAAASIDPGTTLLNFSIVS